MSRPRVFTITANRDIPELRLTPGDVVTVDRRHPVAPVTLTGAEGARIPRMDPAYLGLLSRVVFRSRPHHKAPPALTVTPSIVGAQHTLENIHAELMGWKSSVQGRSAERRVLRGAVVAALAAPLEAAPREPHASALLGLEVYRRLALYLDRVRQDPEE